VVLVGLMGWGWLCGFFVGLCEVGVRLSLFFVVLVSVVLVNHQRQDGVPPAVGPICDRTMAAICGWSSAR